MAARATTNRLIGESSPYLRQHAHNPVDWYPWGEEALRRALEEERPIFLSIGYAACHWCHVMERECFENPEIARLMNESFVCIKVDREERPDLDELYMNAVQLLTGSGGWPMSVWLTPELKPFYGGTYFPPTDHWGRPGFPSVLRELAAAYRERRAEVEHAADELAQALERMARVPAPGKEPLTRDPVRRALFALERGFDRVCGGFGGAPKFPPSAGLALLLHEYRREGSVGLLEMATRTLDAMARGGLFDQVGGGFHRYSTDACWLVPHFEKMLYDNALLVPFFLDAYQITGDPFYQRIAVETLAWVAREMTHPEGGFFSSLDADSEGEEGRFYLWTPDEVLQILGAEEGALFNRVYGITPEGNFEGRNIPHLRRPVAEWAQELKLEPDALGACLGSMRARLYEVRAKRVWPAKDDKILTGWNGLMISAFARAAGARDDPAYADAARRAAGFLLDRMRENGRLQHTFREGTASVPAFQDDYAFLANGLLDLHAATGEARWRDEARALVEEMIDLFWDESDGGFFYTGRDQEMPIARGKNPYDGVIPSGNSAAVLALLRLRELGAGDDLERYIRETLSAFHPLMEQAPEAFHNMELALDRALEFQAAHPAPFPALPDVVHIEATLADAAASPGGCLPLTVRLHIDPGWHINAHQPAQEYLVPTTVEVLPGPGLRVPELRYPDPVRYRPEFSDEELELYEGDIELATEVMVQPDADPGDSELTLRVRTQACDARRCLTPVETELAVPVRIAA